jgi:SAM-dependent methyltransferase
LKSTHKIWDEHYRKIKSKLLYPDENLVRILSKISINNGKALDFGAGSGRHSQLLKNFNFNVTALDSSTNSLDLIKEIDPEIKTVLSSSPPYPFENYEFDLIVSWGVLHYNDNETIHHIIEEYHRILNKNGFLAGTIRSIGDTHLALKQGISNLEDLQGAEARLFKKDEVIQFFSKFSNLELGYMERTPIGKLEERICHWIFLAKK